MKLLISFALSIPLAACAGNAPPYTLIATDSLCKSWRHQTIKSSDKLDETTASQIEGNNKARPEWGCQYGKNEAKS